MCTCVALLKVCARDKSLPSSSASACYDIPRGWASTQSLDPSTVWLPCCVQILTTWDCTACEGYTEARMISNIKPSLHCSIYIKTTTCNCHIFQETLLLKMISVCKTKFILITNQPEKIRNFIKAIKKDCKNLMIETLSIPNFKVLGSSSTLLLINH